MGYLLHTLRLIAEEPKYYRALSLHVNHTVHLSENIVFLFFVMKKQRGNSVKISIFTILGSTEDPITTKELFSLSSTDTDVAVKHHGRR